MTYKTIEPPLARTVTVEEQKAHSKVENTVEDILIAIMISSAERMAEAFTGLALITRTVQFETYGFGKFIAPPVTPAQEIVSIKYFDQRGDEQTLPASEYRLVDALDFPKIVPAPGSSWPAIGDYPSPVTITYKAGISDDPADIPADIKMAVMLIAASLYAYRENDNTSALHEIPMSAQDYLGNHKLYRFSHG